MLAALESAVTRRDTRWTHEREIAATTLEVLHSLVLVTLRANGAKGVGKPLHIERPHEREAKRKPIRFSEFARMIGA